MTIRENGDSVRTSAVIFKGKDDVKLGEIEISASGPDEVQVKTTASLISTGTERWILSDVFAPSGTPYPCVPGYQRTGIITKLGSNVQGFAIGERVIVTSGQWNGSVSSYWGSHLATANSHKREIYKLPDGVKDADAAGVVVAQVGYNAASRVQLSGDDWVIIYGDGLIGQCASQAVRARGAKTILVGHRKERLELAAQYSADYTINSHAGNVLEQVLVITSGRKATAVLDTVQIERVQQEYIPLLQSGVGQIVYCGFTAGKVWADMALLSLHELTCHYVSDWNHQRIEATIQLMAEGRISLEPIVTHRGTPAEAPQLYQMLLDNKEPFLGILIDWSDQA
jgi:2-desacetyl-2-hydroxyethyl bacteriochlorophyllide A dehydrogenase